MKSTWLGRCSVKGRSQRRGAVKLWSTKLWSRRFLSLTLSAGLIACSSGSSGSLSSRRGSGSRLSRPGAPQTAITRIETRQYRPDSRAATKYKSLDPTRPPATPLGRRMAKAGFAYDEKLSLMADDVAKAIPGGIFEVPPQLVEGMMTWYGMAGVAPNLLIFEQKGSEYDAQGKVCDPNRCPPDPSTFSSALQGLAPSATRDVKVTGWSRWHALGPNHWRKVIALAENPVKLAPLPKSVRRGQAVTLGGRLSKGLRDPRVWVAPPGGRAFEIRSSRPSGANFRFRVPCGQARGAYQVELVADGQYGPEVLSNFPLYCDAPPPRILNYRVESVHPKASARQLERLSFDLINEVRRRYRLPLLAWSDEVAEVARKHSRDMERLDYVGHVSPRTGSLGDRMRRGKIKSALALENVALGSGPYSILDSLMLSPGHQANLLNPRVTHVGVGIELRETLGRSSKGREDSRVSLYLTQNFIAKSQSSTKKAGKKAVSIRLVMHNCAQKGLGNAEMDGQNEVPLEQWLADWPMSPQGPAQADGPVDLRLGEPTGSTARESEKP